MNITPEELEIIENYLNKNQSVEELNAFEQRLSTDEEWKQKLDEVRLLVTGIREGALAERMIEYHKSFAAETLPLKPPRELAWKKIWWAAASIVIVLVATWLLVKPPATDKLFTEFYSADPGLATTMSAGTGNEYTFMKGMVDYKTGNYELALNAWKQLLAERPASDTLNYFTGCAMLAMQKTAQSLPFFEKVGANSPFVKDALWYKGLALLKLGRLQEASAAATASGHEKAGALLEKLR